MSPAQRQEHDRPPRLSFDGKQLHLNILARSKDMQGTAGTESVELYEMYNLPVERVPPNRPVLRIDNAMEVSALFCNM